jgi:hypothetical protein
MGGVWEWRVERTEGVEGMEWLGEVEGHSVSLLG